MCCGAKGAVAMILRIDHVHLAMPKGEEDRARQFYSGVLGLAEVAKPAPLAARGGCWFTTGAVVIHLGVQDDFVPAKKAHPAFVVESVDELQKRLLEAGFEVMKDDAVPGVKRFFTFDPFGNRVEFIEDGKTFQGEKSFHGGLSLKDSRTFQDGTS